MVKSLASAIPVKVYQYDELIELEHDYLRMYSFMLMGTISKDSLYFKRYMEIVLGRRYTLMGKIGF
jgi:hypothetical protein